MRRIVACIMVMLFTLSMTACTTAQPETSSTTTTTATTSTPKPVTPAPVQESDPEPVAEEEEDYDESLGAYGMFNEEADQYETDMAGEIVDIGYGEYCGTYYSSNTTDVLIVSKLGNQTLRISVWDSGYFDEWEDSCTVQLVTPEREWDYAEFQMVSCSGSRFQGCTIMFKAYNPDEPNELFHTCSMDIFFPNGEMMTLSQ